VKCRGGFEVGFEWDDGMVKGPVIVNSELGRRGKVVFGESGKEVWFYGKGEHGISEPNEKI
jgi:hypothetical protein